MMRRIAGSLAGVVALAALILGVPALLWTVGSNLLPDHVPSLSEVWTALTTQDSGRLFIGALLMLCTVAWALLMVVLALEIPAALSGRQRRPVRGLTWAQRTASVLLFLILTGTVTSTAAVALPLPPLAAASTHRTVPTLAASTLSAPLPVAVPTMVATEPQTATWTVRSGDTLWSIAERTLRSGERAGEIFALNAHVVQADGGVLSPTSYPQPGWILHLPDDANPATPAATTVGEVMVQPGDSLAEIAERELGDEALYPQLAAENGIADPDVIHPGQIIRIPQTPATTPSTATVGEVVVQPGDSLAEIAERELGDEALYPQLAAENGIADPDVIHPGQIIQIPHSPTTKDTSPTKIGTATPEVPPAETAPPDSPIVVQPDLSAEAEPDLPAEAEPDLPAEVDPDVSAEAEPDVPAEAEPDMSAEAEPDLPAEAEPDLPAEVDPDVSAEAEPDVPAEAEPDLPAEVDPDVSAEAEPDVPAEAEPDLPAKAEPALPAQAEPDLPAEAPAPEEAAPAPTEAAASPAAPEAPPQSSTPPLTAPAPAAPPPAPPTSTPPNFSTTPTSTPPVAPGMSAAAPDAAAAVSNADDINISPYLGLTAAAAAAAAFGLAVARRRGSQRRLPGRQAQRPSLAAVHAENTVRERAATVDIAWLDLALRSLGTVLSAPSATVPDITAAYLSADGLRLQLSVAEPAPAPFITDGETWWLPATADLPVLALGAVDQLTPVPTLTSIGVRGVEIVMVDLERLGTVQLDGPTAECRALLTHIAVEVAHQTWCDDIDVVLVGWGADLVPLNPDRLTYVPDIAAVAAEVTSRAGAVNRALTDLGMTAGQARARDIAADSWTPQVLLIDGSAVADPTVLGQLVELRRSRSTTAFIVSGDGLPALAGATRIHLADGELSLPAVLGPHETITPAAVTDQEVQHLLSLHKSALQVDVPIPLSTRHESWAQHMDESGALVPPIDIPEPVELWAAAAAQDQPPQPTDVVQQRVESAVATSPSGPTADVAKLHSVLAADPTLDEDLAEWKSDTIRRPRIAVLGNVIVHGAGMPKGQPKWSEIATYLALHPRGVRHDKMGEDLYAGRAAGTRRQALHKTRVWLGHDPVADSPYIPHNPDVVRLDGRLLDSELFTRLRVRGDAKAAAGDPTALTDYLSALRLVRGPILPEASTKTGWQWLHNPECGEHRTLPQHVVDAAHRAVQVALAAGDVDNAKWAADVAHRTDVDDPTPMVDLMIIAATAGDMAAANSLAWRVLDAHQKYAGSGGVFELEDLPPDTFQIIHRMFPTGLRTPVQEAASR